MNLANKLTLSRFFMIPMMLIVLSISSFQNHQLFWTLTTSEFLFALLFVLAGFTDFLDGYIARKTQTITTFGKFLDPIADKVLVLTAFSYLLFVQIIPIWVIVIIILREFMVSGLRLIAVEEKIVISASQLGKYKTAWTMLTLTYLLFEGYEWNMIVSSVLIWITVILTVSSGLEYLYKYRQVFTKQI
ncbi:MAG: CDP-diacylglycerol--glycerol-3-phosphate 3-phosphatidyltransferase [Acholeplasmataceae bacterium]